MKQLDNNYQKKKWQEDEEEEGNLVKSIFIPFAILSQHPLGVIVLDNNGIKLE